MRAATNPVLQAAEEYVRAGISVVPIQDDGTKQPAWQVLPKVPEPETGRYKSTWKLFEKRLPTPEELQRWFSAGKYGIALVGGAISGNLEQLDFDTRAEETFTRWLELVRAERPGLDERLSVQRSPRGGYHVRYRCSDVTIPGNIKLARDPSSPPRQQVLIETRGEGGYCLAPGSPAACHETGGLYIHFEGPPIIHLEDLTAAEREVLWRCARALDLSATATGSGLRPGDTYDQTGPDWAKILQPHGWVLVKTDGEVCYWRRPGKDRGGWSATTGHCKGPKGEPLLRVFSSDAAPFEPEKAYGKFRAFALLNHRGDLHAAAAALAREGFGDRSASRNGKADPARNGKAVPPTAAFPLPIPASRLRHSGAKPWIWQPFLSRGGLTLFSALWKAGKTTLLAHLLKALEGSDTFCGLNVTPGWVLYVTEESEGRWAQRRDQLGLGDHVEFLIRPVGTKPDWPTWEQFLRYLGELRSRNGYDLIVLDPLSNLWPVRDENDAPQVQAALMPLREAVGEQAAAMLVHHNRKSDGQEATAARGSGALSAFVDTIVELRRYAAGDREDHRRVLTGYGRHEETADLADLVVQLADGAYQAQGDRKAVSGQEIATILLALLPREAPGWTTVEVEEHWPEDTGRRREALLMALHHGAETGLWVQEGEGKRGSPYRFWRPL